MAASLAIDISLNTDEVAAAAARLEGVIDEATSQFQKDFDASSKEVEEFRKQLVKTASNEFSKGLAHDIKKTGDAANDATSRISNFRNALVSIKNVAIGSFIGQAALDGLYKLMDLFPQLIARAQKFSDIAGALGGGEALGVAVQANVMALSQLGIAMDNSSAGLTKYAQSLQQNVAGASTKGAKAIDLLGVSIKNADGSMRPFNDIMADTMVKINQMPPGIQRTTAVMNAFGKALGPELLGQIGLTREEYTKLVDEFTSSAAAWQTLGSLSEELGSQMEGLLLNALTPLVEMISLVVAGVQSAWPVFKDLADQALNAAKEVLGMNSGLDGTAGAATGAAGAAAILVGKLAGLISTFIDLAQAAIAAGKAMAAAFKIGYNLDTALDPVLAGASLVEAATGHVTDMSRKHRQAVEDIRSGMKDLHTGKEEAAKAMEGSSERAAEADRKAAEASRKGIEEQIANLKRLREEAGKTAAGVGGALGGGGGKGKGRGGGGGGKKGGGGGGGGGGAAKKDDDQYSTKQLQSFINKTREAMAVDAAAKGDMARAWELYEQQAQESLTMVETAIKLKLLPEAEKQAFLDFTNKQHRIKLKIEKEDLINFREIADDFAKNFESWGQSLASGLADAVVEGEDLSEVLENSLKSLAKMVLETMVLGPLMKALTSGFSGITGFSGGGGGTGGLYSVAPAQMMPTVPLPQGLLGGPAVTPMYAAALPQATVRASQGGGGGKGSVSQKNAVAITVNTRAGVESTDAKGQGEDGKALAARLDAAVRVVLMKESRPGGILRRGN